MAEKDKNKLKVDLLKESNLTYDDYASIDDENRYELVNGKLELMTPGPSVTHQMISYEIQKAISKTCETDYIILNAPLDVILAPNEVRQPDLILVHRERIHIISKHGIEGAPDLVVEILSPSTLKRDKIDKLNTYATYTIPEYWVVDPEKAILEQYVLRDGRYEIVNIFQDDEQVASPNIACVAFSMEQVMDKIPKLAD